jgi:putative FmdB family regulatory protein
MPTYSYLCDACGSSFEIEQRITEDPIKKCVECGKPEARRQITSGNFILKGGGWYSDGYGSKPSASAAKIDPGSKVGPVPKTEAGAKADASSPPAKGDKADTPSKSDSGTKPDASPTKPESSSKAAAAE